MTGSDDDHSWIPVPAYIPAQPPTAEDYEKLNACRIAEREFLITELRKITALRDVLEKDNWKLRALVTNAQKELDAEIKRYRELTESF